MMKKCLWCLLLCLFMSAGAAAQDGLLDEAYAGWKANTTSDMKNESIRYCLASWIKKVDEKKASIQFIAYGNINSFTLKLTPLYVERDKDRKILSEKAGQSSTARQSGPGSGQRSELNVVIPIESDSNSIRVEWDFVSNGKKYSHSHIISMLDDPGINFLAVILPK